MKLSILNRVTNNILIDSVLELDHELIIANYSHDKDLTEYILKDLAFSPKSSSVFMKDKACYIEHQSIDKDQCLQYITKMSGDIIVFIDDVIELTDGWLELLTAPFQDDYVKFTYCDFISGHLPIFHTTLPSKITKFPLCAFRKNIIQSVPHDLLQQMSGNVMSRYIPEILAKIDDTI